MALNTKRALIWGLAAMITAAPWLATSTATLSAPLPTLAFPLQISGCSMVATPANAYVPDVEADLARDTHYACSPGLRLSVHEYYFGEQVSGREAVSRDNQYVPVEQKQRFGVQRVSTSFGKVNAFRSESDDGFEVLTWQWYVLDGEVYASASEVKLRELGSAILLDLERPSSFAVRGLRDTASGPYLDHTTITPILEQVVGASIQ